MNSYIVLTLCTLGSILILLVESKSISKTRNEECSIREVISHFVAVICLLSHVLFELDFIIPVILFNFIIFFAKEKSSKEIKKSVSTIALILGSFVCLKHIDSIYMKIVFVIIFNCSVELLLHYKKYKVTFIRLLYSFVILISNDLKETLMSFLVVSVLELILYKGLKRTIPLSFKGLDKINMKFLQLSLLALIIGVYVQ